MSASVLKFSKKNLAKALLLINLRCKHCLMYGVCSVHLPNSRDMGDSPALTIIYITSFLHVTWAEDKYILELTFKSQSKKARGVTGQPKPLPIVTSLLDEETRNFLTVEDYSTAQPIPGVQKTKDWSLGNKTIEGACQCLGLLSPAVCVHRNAQAPRIAAAHNLVKNNKPTESCVSL